jgi:activator of HSP90 ATPase
MTEPTLTTLPPDVSTRRQIVTRIAMVCGALATGSSAVAQAAQTTMKKVPADPANQARTSLHMDVEIKAAPQRIYEALMDAKQFAAFSGLPAEIDAKAGGAFSMFQGQIIGRNVDLVAGQRIIQAWRATHWNADIYSIAKFELKPSAAGTTVVLDHTGFPTGEYDALLWGWGNHYWEPLKKFLV